MTARELHLTVAAPVATVLDERTEKIVAEAEDGAFCLLPRHVDFVAALVPGVVIYQLDGGERFVAVNGGILVKQGNSVTVATAEAVPGDELAALHRVVEEEFLAEDEHERAARSVLARLEAGALRRFIDVAEGRHGR